MMICFTLRGVCPLLSFIMNTFLITSSKPQKKNNKMADVYCQTCKIYTSVRDYERNGYIDNDNKFCMKNETRDRFC